MTIIMDVNEATPNRRPIDVPNYTRTSRPEDSYYATLYMGVAPANTGDDMVDLGADKSMPQAYLVEQPATSIVPAHYHDTDQFQVFTEGRVVFGKKPINAVSIHYAGGHTPYGPIRTEDEIAHFFTFRRQWDSGGKPMPEMRDSLKRCRRVYRLVDNILEQAKANEMTDILPCEGDGLGTGLLSLDEGVERTADLSVPGAGQYALVVSGSVLHDGMMLAKDSCLWRNPDEAPLTFTGGPDGGQILLLQFPIQDD